jgi:hypothetical protein
MNVFGIECKPKRERARVRGCFDEEEKDDRKNRAKRCVSLGRWYLS